MIFYIIAICILFFCTIEFYLKIANADFVTSINTKNILYYRFFYLSLFVFLILFCGFRAEGVDRDFPEYVSMLEQVPPFPAVLTADLTDVHGDPFFYFISSVINLIDGPSYLLFLTFSILSLTLYRWCFVKFSYFPLLSLFIYFCHSFLNKEMTQIRNGLSSAFLLMMLCCLSERKKLKSLYYFILSFLAHSSGFVGVLLYFNKFKFKNSNLKFYVGFTLSLVVYFTWHNFFLLLPQNIDVVQKINQYINWDLYNYSLSFINPIFLKGLFYFFLFLYVKKKIGLDERFDVFIFSYFLSVCFYIAFNDIAILGARIANMLSVSEYILVPAIIARLLECGKKFEGIVVFLITITIGIVLLYSNLEIKNIFGDYRTIVFS